MKKLSLLLLLLLSLVTAQAEPVIGKVALEVHFDPTTAMKDEGFMAVRNFIKVYKENEKPFVAQSFKELGRATPHYVVFAATGATAYEGDDSRATMECVVNALTDMPQPGQLVSPSILKKYKPLQKKLMLGQNLEGSTIKQIERGLKDKNVAVAAEAKAILDEVAAAHKILPVAISAALTNDPPVALRDMMLYVKTWPSEKAKYEADIKRLSADAPTLKAAKQLMNPKKK